MIPNSFRCEVLEGGTNPTRAHDDDAGYDLYARETVAIPSGQVALVRCGFKLQLEPGWEGQVRGRSGMAKKNIRCHFGTVDAGYRGEVGALIHNDSETEFIAEKGKAVAQIVFKQVPRVTLIFEPIQDTTERGANGFGSTGRF